MGTEVTIIPIDKEASSTVITAKNGTSNQVNGLRSKSPSVDESGGARRDLWGPRIFGNEQKESKESKESDVKKCIVSSPVEVFPSHQDASTPKKSLNPEGQDRRNYEESDSPIKSVSRPDSVGTLKTPNVDSHPFPHATKLSASAGNQGSTDSAAHGNKPAKVNIIQATDSPGKSKGSPNCKTRKPLQSYSATNTDEDPCSPVLSIASVRSHTTRTTVAIAPVFKSSERAEKRKEFYAKLEQKQKALEAEKTQSEARSKEEMEVALKEYRKNLIYKATPIPSFYQEGPPPKVELKKTPPTRAKSPKLGRRRICNDASNGDNNNGICYRLTRCSIDSYKGDRNKLQDSPKIGNAASKSKGKF